MTKDTHVSTSGNPVAAGIALMCLGCFCMVALDVSVRFLLEKYSLLQVVLLRCTFSAILILAIAAARGDLDRLRTKRPGWHAARSVLMTGSMLSFFYALSYLPLADIIIFAFAAPLVVTALSRPFLGEAVGPWRWGAVIAGFLGVLVVLRPGTGSVHPAAFFAVFGAVMYAGLSLTARKLAKTENSLSLSLYVFVVPWSVAAVGAPATWLAPDAADWVVFFLSGVFGGIAIVLINAAYQRAAVAVVVPFEYTALVWAAAAGYLFWGEVPDRATWLGAAIITGSGLFILYRETRAAPVGEAEPTGFPLQEAIGAASEDEAL